MRHGILLIGLVSATAISGCGGGGEESSTPSDIRDTNINTTLPEGQWKGSGSGGRSINGVLLDDGSYWMFYSIPGNSAVVGGVIQGNGTAINGVFTSSDGKDLNLEGFPVNNVSVEAAFVSKKSLAGVMKYPGSIEAHFSNSYDADYELTPSLNTIEGIYSGTAYTKNSTDSATVTISSNGEISGASTSGCNFTGSVTTHATGNLYDITVTFAGPPCTNGTETVKGVADYDATTSLIRSATLNSSRDNGFLFFGNKP